MQVFGDASAAIGIIKRYGLGKTRHISTALLWVQEKWSKGQVVYDKVSGVDNTADLLTKHVSLELIDRHCRALNCEFSEGHDSLGYSLDAVVDYGYPK